MSLDNHSQPSALHDHDDEPECATPDLGNSTADSRIRAAPLCSCQQSSQGSYLLLLLYSVAARQSSSHVFFCLRISSTSIWGEGDMMSAPKTAACQEPPPIDLAGHSPPPPSEQRQILPQRGRCSTGFYHQTVHPAPTARRSRITDSNQTFLALRRTDRLLCSVPAGHRTIFRPHGRKHRRYCRLTDASRRLQALA